MQHITDILLLLLLMVSIRHRSLADLFEECNSSNNNNFIASNRSCIHYIFCNGEDSFEGECPEENDYFNAQLAMCEPMEGTDCRTGLPLQSTVSESPATETVKVDEVETTTINSSSAANVILETVTGAPAIASTASSILTNQVVNIVASECPRADNPNQIVLLAYDKSCTEYFICYHGKPLPMTCAAMLHFNAKTGKCDKAEIVNCMRSTISVREQCKLHTVDIYPHPDNCNYFYYCRNGYLMLQQCPFFYGWDYEKRSCVAISRAKCFGTIRL